FHGWDGLRQSVPSGAREGEGSMIDVFTTPLLTPDETARHLQLPVTTLRDWMRQEAVGEPLVHSSSTPGSDGVPPSLSAPRSQWTPSLVCGALVSQLMLSLRSTG